MSYIAIKTAQVIFQALTVQFVQTQLNMIRPCAIFLMMKTHMDLWQYTRIRYSSHLKLWLKMYISK